MNNSSHIDTEALNIASIEQMASGIVFITSLYRQLKGGFDLLRLANKLITEGPHLLELYKKDFATSVDFYKKQPINTIAQLAAEIFPKLTFPLEIKTVINELLEEELRTNTLTSIIAKISQTEVYEQLVHKTKSWEMTEDLDQAINDEEIVTQLSELAKTDDTSEFLGSFLELPQSIQGFILFLLVSLSISITGNFLTDEIKAHLESNKEKPKAIVIRELKATNLSLPDFIKEYDCGFIYASNVRLRTGPSTQHQVVTVLDKGQVIKIINSKPYWSEVEIISSKEALTGWVATQFIGHFKK